MAQEKTLEDAFYETLKDVYYAEKASVKAGRSRPRQQSPPELQHAFNLHAEESAN